MSFNPNIPLGTDKILISAKQIRSNFQSINSAFRDNHQALTSDPSIAGMHNVLTMQQQSGDPATSATQVALYNKSDGIAPELFFRPNSNQTPIQLTYSSIKSDSTDTQYSFMAGPFIIYIGKITAPTNGQLITLLPTSTLVFVNLNATNFSGKISSIADVPFSPFPSTIVANTFILKYPGYVTTQGLTMDVFYIAIGKP